MRIPFLHINTRRSSINPALQDKIGSLKAIRKFKILNLIALIAQFEPQTPGIVRDTEFDRTGKPALVLDVVALAQISIAALQTRVRIEVRNVFVRRKHAAGNRSYRAPPNHELFIHNTDLLSIVFNFISPFPMYSS